MILLSNVINIINNNLIIMISILLIIISIIVLTRINPMISLFNLIIFYVLLGLLLYKLNLNVLGLLYILIYVGAISVLFIFILSLINIKYSELTYKSYSPDILLIIYSFILFTLLVNIDLEELNLLYNNELISEFTSRILNSQELTLKTDIINLSINNNYNVLNIWFNDFNYINNIIEFKTIGELLYTEYSILFLLLGLILLLSIISAIVLIFRNSVKSYK